MLDIKIESEVVRELKPAPDIYCPHCGALMKLGTFIKIKKATIVCPGCERESVITVEEK